MTSAVSKNDEKELQLVPEILLKRRHDMDEMKARRAAQALANPRGNRKIASKNPILKVHKPEKYLADGRCRRNHDIRYQRVLKKGMQKRASNKVQIVTKQVQKKDPNTSGKNYVVEERSYAANSVGASVVFVVRMRDNVAVPRSVHRVLKQFRLKQKYDGVFLRYNATTRKMLHLAEPFVLYGILSKSTISDLIHRRGHGKVDGERVPLNNNLVVENALEKDTGIICVEDLVHEISSVGTNFAKASNFLWPFRLTAPKTKFQKDKLDYHDTREDYGDKGEEMEDYLKTML